MSKKNFVLASSVLIVLLALLWFFLPASLGLKAQLAALFDLVLKLVAIVAFIVEIVIATIWPFVLGAVHPVARLDEKVDRSLYMGKWQKIAIHVLFALIVFLLGLVVALSTTVIYPISQWGIGPFISSVSESHIVWFGVYAVVAYAVTSALTAE